MKKQQHFFNPLHFACSVLCFLAFSLSSTLYAQQGVYQLPNGGFETWYRETSNANSIVPTGFNSYYSAETTVFTALGVDKRCDSSRDVRAEATGRLSLYIYSNTAAGVRANGNVTTGRIRMGSITPASSDNYNSIRVGTPKHCQEFTGTPDSLRFWVKYAPGRTGTAGGVNNTTDYGRINAVIHGTSNVISDANRIFRDPRDASNLGSWYGMATSEMLQTNNQWVQIATPFVYRGTNTATLPNGNRYLLLTMTTNATPGGGANNADQIWFDDIEFIYNTYLTDLKVNSVTIPDFNRNTFTYYYPVCSEASYPTISYDEDALRSYSPRAYADIEQASIYNNGVATITVKHHGWHVDSSSVYRVHFITPQTPVANNSLSLCGAGNMAEFSATPSHPSFLCRWYASFSDETPVHTGNTYTLALTENATFWASTYSEFANCESDRTPVTVTVNPRPATPVVTGDILCKNSTAMLTAEVGLNGTTCRWYTLSGELIHTGLSYNPLLTQTATYKVTSYRDGCESDSVEVMAVVNEIPEMPLHGNDTSCGAASFLLYPSIQGENISVIWYNDNTLATAVDTALFYETMFTQTTTLYMTSYNRITHCQSAAQPITITIFPVYAPDTIFQTICEIAFYDFFGKRLTVEGIYDTIIKTVHNCDSLVVLDLKISDSYVTPVRVSICEGDSYHFGAEILNKTGVYRDTVPAENGCDSITILNLTVNLPSFIEINDEICEGAYYTKHGFNLLAEKDTLLVSSLKNMANCDSTITIHLAVKQRITTPFLQEITECEYYVWNDSTYTKTGVYTQTFLAANGCDSIVTLTLIINQPSDTTRLLDTICQGEPYTKNGFNLDEQYTAGTHAPRYLRLDNATGCDSIVMLTLTVNRVWSQTRDITACDAYAWNDSTYTVSTVITHRTQTTFGCDSIVIINLTINQSPDVQYFTDTICMGVPYSGYGFNIPAYDTAGVFTERRAIRLNTTCDSIMFLTLTVMPNYIIRIEDSIAAGETYTKHGFFVVTDRPNFYRDTLYRSTEFGCDSTIILRLDAKPETGISEYGKELTVNLYPNPTTGKLTIDNGQLIINNVEFFDIYGRNVHSSPVACNSSFVTIDISHFSAGIYFIRMQTNEGIVTQKVIKN